MCCYKKTFQENKVSEAESSDSDVEVENSTNEIPEVDNDMFNKEWRAIAGLLDGIFSFAYVAYGDIYPHHYILCGIAL